MSDFNRLTGNFLYTETEVPVTFFPLNIKLPGRYRQLYELAAKSEFYLTTGNFYKPKLR